MEEPRTNAEMWSDALRLLQDCEFRNGYRRDWDRSYRECPECDATEYDRAERTGEIEDPKHKPGCAMARALRELPAFIAAEERLEEERAARDPD